MGGRGGRTSVVHTNHLALGGRDWDIPAAMPRPHRLEAITVCSSLAAVDAISFSYFDDQGRRHCVAPWGGRGGNPYVVRLEPSEILTEVSGTFAYIGTQPTDAVTSLTFVTNLGKHGPFGDVDDATAAASSACLAAAGTTSMPSGSTSVPHDEYIQYVAAAIKY